MNLMIVDSDIVRVNLLNQVVNSDNVSHVYLLFHPKNRQQLKLTKQNSHETLFIRVRVTTIYD